MAHVKTILKQSSSMMVSWVLSTAISFFSTILFTHYVDKDIFGSFTLVRTMIVMLGILGVFGLNHGLLRQGSIALGKKDEATYDNIKNFTISYTWVIGLALATLVFFFAPQIASSWFKNPDLTIYIKWFTIAIPIQINCNMFLTLCQVNHRADKGQFLYLVVYFVLIAACFFLFTFFAKGDLLMILSFVTANIIFLPIMLYHQIKFKYKFSFTLNKIERKNLFGISFPMFIGSVFTESQRWGDTIFLGVLSNITNVGIYYVGLRIGAFVSIPSNAINKIFAPIAGRLIGQQKHDELNALYKLVTRMIFVFGSLIFGGIFFLKTYLLQLFGNGYDDTSSVILLILISEAVDFSVGAANRLITMSGGGKINLINSVLTLAINVSASLILIPKYGLVGAALANLLANGTLNIVGVLELMIIYKLSPFNSKYIILITLFLAVIVTIAQTSMGDVVKFVVFSSIMAVIYYFLAITKKEKILLKEMVPLKNFKIISKTDNQKK